MKHSLLRMFRNYDSFYYQLVKLLIDNILQVHNGMSYNLETSLINYVSKYIGYTFYSDTMNMFISINTIFFKEPDINLNFKLPYYYYEYSYLC